MFGIGQASKKKEKEKELEILKNRRVHHAQYSALRRFRKRQEKEEVWVGQVNRTAKALHRKGVPTKVIERYKELELTELTCARGVNAIGKNLRKNCKRRRLNRIARLSRRVHRHAS